MRGFFDESGIHDASRVTTIAGWMFATDHAQPCWGEWSQCIALKGMDAFHASSFDHFVKVHKWSDEEYDDFIETLTAILKKYAWFGLCGSVVTSDYDALPPWLKKRIGGRYHFCFHVLMHQIAERMHSIVDRLPPLMVFERKDKVIGRSLAAFANLNNYRLGTMTFATKQQCPMLQTADFLVYEVNRWLDDQLHSGKSPRIQIQKLATADKGRYKFLRYGYHDEETLSHLVARLESDPDHGIWLGRNQWWPDSWYPNYVPEKPDPDGYEAALRALQRGRNRKKN
jgi:hypothetical protein